MLFEGKIKGKKNFELVAKNYQSHLVFYAPFITVALTLWSMEGHISDWWLFQELSNPGAQFNN